MLVTQIPAIQKGPDVLKLLLTPKISALLALLVYGGWAAFSNWDYGLFVSTKAFFAQGVFAFTATLFLGLTAVVLYQKWGPSHFAFTCSFLLCLTIMSTLPALIHWLIGTPNIVQSILPGLIWGSAYIALTLFHKHKELHT